MSHPVAALQVRSLGFRVGRAAVLCVGLFGVLTPSVACRPRELASDALTVAVSVPPQAYFVDRIGGSRVRTEVMIPPGASETSYSPSPRQLVAMSRAALYVKVGHPAFLFEANHVDRFLAEHPKTRVVDMSEGIETLPSTASEGRLETPGFFGDSHDHDDHAQGDPHVWVAPGTVKIAAANIAQALCELDPPHAQEYRARLATFLAEIDALDREIRAELRSTPSRKFMVYHPSWGYFAHEYGLEQVAIEAGGREPSAAQIIHLVERGRAEKIATVFVQRGFARKSAEVIAEELGGRVVVVDPMSYDWLENLRTAARAFRQALEG